MSGLPNIQKCPHCAATNISPRKRLTASGYKTFYCKACKRGFNERTGTEFLEKLEGDEQQLAQGQLVKLKELPFLVRLFKIVAPNGDTLGLITNQPLFNSARVTKQANDVRWQIEQLHRELKQLTGSAKCQSRKERAQRTPIALCYQAWLAIKVKAQALLQSSYLVVNDLFSDYLQAELPNPRIPALHPAD
jgi:hypothetical protein